MERESVGNASKECDPIPTIWECKKGKRGRGKGQWASEKGISMKGQEKRIDRNVHYIYDTMKERMKCMARRGCGGKSRIDRNLDINGSS